MGESYEVTKLREFLEDYITGNKKYELDLRSTLIDGEDLVNALDNVGIEYEVKERGKEDKNNSGKKTKNLIELVGEFQDGKRFEDDNLDLLTEEIENALQGKIGYANKIREILNKYKQ